MGGVNGLVLIKRVLWFGKLRILGPLHLYKAKRVFKNVFSGK
jgi:hypothetical protein